MIPIGKLKILLPATKHKVPTMAGKIPPLVIPSSGALVRKSQLITPIPRIMINPRITNKIATTE